MKHVMILNTGGTISSTLSPAGGLTPKLTTEELLNKTKITHTLTVPAIGKVSLESEMLMLKDSTNMCPRDWVIIAKKIYKYSTEYDGIVVMHGTDTMAYTTSMMSFMVMGLDIPVVFTGSMQPPLAKNSDAVINLKNSIYVASNNIFNGILLTLGNCVSLGCRASKTRLYSNSSFESINMPPIATVTKAGHILHVKKNIDKISKQSCGLQLKTRYNSNIKLVKLFPGIRLSECDAAMQGYSGMIIESYGVGGLPNLSGNNLLNVIKRVSSKIPVIIDSQSTYGKTDLNEYQVGVDAIHAGVMESLDMSKEATITKMMWALGQQTLNNSVSFKSIMRTNYVGEIMN